VIHTLTYPVTPGVTYDVYVGDGGMGGNFQNVAGQPGSNSSFASLTAVGGGAGSAYQNQSSVANGGSGGGAANGTQQGYGVTGQGHDGGISLQQDGGGGGGAGGSGAAPFTNKTTYTTYGELVGPASVPTSLVAACAMLVAVGVDQMGLVGQGVALEGVGMGEAQVQGGCQELPILGMAEEGLALIHQQMQAKVAVALSSYPMEAALQHSTVQPEPLLVAMCDMSTPKATCLQHPIVLCK
jgi:hypothetical protein